VCVHQRPPPKPPPKPEKKTAKERGFERGYIINSNIKECCKALFSIKEKSKWK